MRKSVARFKTILPGQLSKLSDPGQDSIPSFYCIILENAVSEADKERLVISFSHIFEAGAIIEIGPCIKPLVIKIPAGIQCQLR